jgi:hypothetical protein
VAASTGSSRVSVIIVALGSLLTGALVLTATRSLNTTEASQPSLQIVTRDQIEAAVASLDPKLAGAAVEDARQCKVPLASVILAAAPGAPPGSVRIRSGGYLSPPIAVTNAPQRVAVPFPAPYPTGKGILSVEGAATGLTVWLSPAWQVGTLNGSAHINVIWFPKNPC